MRRSGTYTLTILPFSDPGEPTRASAVKAYTDARTGLDGFGHTAADEVRGACSGAPAHRNWLESGLAFVGDVFVGVFEAVVDLGKLAILPMTLLNDLTSDLAALATGELTPEELATKYQLKAEDAQALFTAIKDHPGDVAIALGKGILDWDTWADDPAKAIGHLIPDIVITIATLGAGGAAAGAERGATGIVRGADAAEDLTGAASKLDDLGDLSKVDSRLQLKDPLPDLSDITHPKGSPEWAQEVNRRYPELSPEGAQGIYDYTTGDGYQTMNKAARSPGELSPSELAAAQQRIARTDEGLRQLPTQAGTTFRGTDLPGFLAKDYRIGSTIRDPAFVSTSTDAAVAQQFRGDGNALVEIQGQSGRAVEKLSHYGDEGEILYPRGIEFRVMDVREMGNYRYYVVKELTK